MTFSWDDGTNALYSTSLWIPNTRYNPQVRGEVINTLDNGAVYCTTAPAAGTDISLPKAYTLEWGTENPADPDFVALADEAFCNAYTIDTAIPDPYDHDDVVTLTGYYVTAFQHDTLPGRQHTLTITLQQVS